MYIYLIYIYTYIYIYLYLYIYVVFLELLKIILYYPSISLGESCHTIIPTRQNRLHAVDPGQPTRGKDRANFALAEAWERCVVRHLVAVFFNLDENHGWRGWGGLVEGLNKAEIDEGYKQPKTNKQNNNN